MIALVEDHVKGVRDLGWEGWIIAGGGIRVINHARRYLLAGGVAKTCISYGSIYLTPSARNAAKIKRYVIECHKQGKVL